MLFSIHPITPAFAAEIGDVDLKKPISNKVFLEIENAFNKYSVLVFPGQNINEEQQLRFSKKFGPLEITIQKFRKGVNLRLGPKFADVSNLDRKNNLLSEKSERRLFNSGNRLWHTDSSFRRIPAKCSLLHASSIPPIGGQTEFTDLRAAYDALPKKMKLELEGLVAEHSIQVSRAKIGYDQFTNDEIKNLPSAPQALVRTHPGSGRRTLYLASHAGHVLGMQNKAGKKLLKKLITHATKRQFVYSHRWRPDDLVIWDNRSTMHRGLEFDDLRYKRNMRRTTVRDSAPTCVQENIKLDN